MVGRQLAACGVLSQCLLPCHLGAFGALRFGLGGRQAVGLLAGQGGGFLGGAVQQRGGVAVKGLGLVPFGGVGPSGMGQYHGHEGFLTFSKLKPVFMQSRWNAAGWLDPPYGAPVQRLIELLKRHA